MDISAVSLIDLCHISREWNRFDNTSQFASEKENKNINIYKGFNCDKKYSFTSQYFLELCIWESTHSNS